MVRVDLGQLGFVPSPYLGASPTLYLHDDAPALTLEGDVAMGLGRALASGGDLFGTGADVLILGDAEGAYVIDVAAALAGAPVQAASSADGVQLLAPSTGSTVGQVVGGGLLGGSGLPAAWVGEGPVLHVFHSPAPGAALSPTLSVDVEQAGVTGEVVTAAVALDDGTSGSVGLALGCAACEDASGLEGGAVWLFTGAVVAGTADLDATDADQELYGSAAGARLGTSLAVFDDGRLAMGAPGVSPHGRVVVALDPWQALAMDMWLVGSNNGATGTSVAVGDPNDDGVQQLATGAPEAMFGTSKLGMVRGVNDVLTPGALTSPWFMSGPGGAGAGGPRFGASLAFGDINGDLIDDVLIGAPLAVNTTQTGLLYVILGGLPGNGVANEEVEQYLDGDGDGDGDGVGGPAKFVRCVLEGAAETGDCNDADPLIHPDQLEKCTTFKDDDCEPANDDVLCDERFATAEVAPYADLTGSLWCFEAASWTIGPQGETVKLEDLAKMVDDETLFFDDDLAASMADGTAPASTCAAHDGPTVTLDVISRLGSETAWANSPYKKVLSDNVYDQLQAHGQGYLVGRYDDSDPDAPRYVVLGGDYPGVVNGVVDLLRATEDLPTLRAPWRNQTVLDWPEVERRGVTEASGLGGLLSACTAEGQAVDPASWAGCAAATSTRSAVDDRRAMDYLVRYHLNRVRAGLVSSGPARLHGVLNVVRESTFAKEFILYLRRRGVEVQPFVSVVPDVTDAPEPIGVADLAMEGFDGTPTNRWALPCATDDCSETFDPGVAGYVFNRKYALAIDGDREGLVFARNLVEGHAVEASCTPAAARAAGSCPDGVCFCVETSATASVSGADMWLAAADAATLFLADGAAPNPQGTSLIRHDGDYNHQWGTDAFRPGRLYAIKMTLDRSSDPSDDDLVVKVRMNQPEEDLAEKFTGGDVTVPAYGEAHLVYVFRAPLQRSEFTDLGGSFYYFDPAVRVDVSSTDAAAYVHASDVTVVELDGLSNGWWPNPVTAAPSVVLDEASWDASLHAITTTPADLACGPLVAGGATVPGCVSYTDEVDCGGTPTAVTAGMRLERFVPEGGAWMPAQHLTRLKLAGAVANLPDARASGVVHPVLGVQRANYCGDNANATGFKNTPQHQDPFDFEQWTGKSGVYTVLRFYGTDFAALGGHSVKDYLFGGIGDGTYAWNLDEPRIYLSILDEVRLFNRGLPGWHDGVFRVDSPHAVVRGLFCNLANAVDDEDWTDANYPFYGYCDYFDADGKDCDVDLLTPSLHGTTRCDLDRPGHTGTSEVRIHVDTGMQRDSTTGDFRADFHAMFASLSRRYLSAEVGPDAPSTDGDGTVSNMVSTSVDSRVWIDAFDRQEIYEAVCDVADVSDVFLDHPGLGTTYGANQADRNACMMTGRDPLGTVQLDPAVGAPDAVWQQASFAASASGVVSELNLRRFGFWAPPLTGVLKLDDNPWWAQGAACAWNPGWRAVAQVSMATALSSPGASRFCEAGSAWGSGWGAVPDNQGWTSPLEGNWRMDGKDAARTVSADHMVSMRPEASSMVALPDGSAGRLVRVEVPVSVWPIADPIGRDTCTIRNALVTGTHQQQGRTATVLSGPATGGLWFADASGVLLDVTGAPLATPTSGCETAGGPSGLGTMDVEVRPLMNGDGVLFFAHVVMTAVVPEGAERVGGWVKVPGCAPFNCFPASGGWSVEVSTTPSSGVFPSYAGDDAAYPATSGKPLAADPTFPQRCGDARWFQRVAKDASTNPNVPVHPVTGYSFNSEQAACFYDYLDDQLTP